MRFECWITKAKYTHAEYVTLSAFSRQQWLRERDSVLRYTYVGCLLKLKHFICDPFDDYWEYIPKDIVDGLRIIFVSKKQQVTWGWRK
jgi:hypothetical protein